MRLPPLFLRRITRDRGRLTLAFWMGLALFYVVVYVAAGQLAFPLDRDETHFWPTSQLFSGPITLATLRGYEELNTPLPFLIFGQFARLGDQGLWAARVFNLGLSACVFALVAYGHGRVTARSLRAAAGMALCPYFIGFATHVYTDVIATFLVCLGLWLHLRGRFGMAAASWVFAISTRQYMVAFPLAVALWEFTRIAPNSRRTSRWVWPLLATSSLGGWVLLFGGLVPPQSRWRILAPEAGPIFLDHGLYLLTTVGMYCAMPMALLVRKRIVPKWMSRTHLVAIAAVLAFGFWFMPPLGNPPPNLETMGYFDRGVRRIVGMWPFSSTWRMLVFYAYALFAVLRFSRPPLVAWLLGITGAGMLGAPLAWEKYAVPIVCGVWLLESRPGRTLVAR